VLSYLFIIIQESIETIVVVIVLEAIETLRKKRKVILGEIE